MKKKKTTYGSQDVSGTSPSPNGMFPLSEGSPSPESGSPVLSGEKKSRLRQMTEQSKLVRGYDEEKAEMEVTRPAHFGEVLRIPIKATPTTPVYLKNFWKMLLLVAIFYVVPSIQFVIIQYTEFSQSGNQDVCYFNFKCAQKVAGMFAFNNILSNILYILLGIGFNVMIVIDSKRKAKNETLGVGLHNDMSLYYCLGWCLMLEGFFSGLYHVCPSRLNFQFDTTFMVIGASMLFLALYQKRQPTLLVYTSFAIVILFNTAALLPISAVTFWIIVLVLWTYLSILGSYSMYFYKRIRYDRNMLYSLFFQITHPALPAEKVRFLFITIGNGINYTLLGWATWNGIQMESTKEFPTYLLALAVLDTLIYIIYYIVMKYRSGERVYPRCWLILMFMVVTAGSALNFFTIGTTNKFLSPAQSRALNKPCVVFNFFDDHDVWHFLSSFAILFLYLAVYCDYKNWIHIKTAEMEDDTGLPRKKRGAAEGGTDRPSKKASVSEEPALEWNEETLRYQNKAMINKIELYRQEIAHLNQRIDSSNKRAENNNECLTIADLAWKQLHEGLRQTLSGVTQSHGTESMRQYDRKPSTRGNSFINSLLNSYKDDAEMDDYTSDHKKVRSFYQERSKVISQIMGQIVEMMEEQNKHIRELEASIKSNSPEEKLRLALSEADRLRNEKASLSSTLDEVRSQNVALRASDSKSRGVIMKLEDKIKNIYGQIEDCHDQIEDDQADAAKEQLKQVKEETEREKSQNTTVVVKTEGESNGKLQMNNVPGDVTAEMAELIAQNKVKGSHLERMQEEKVALAREAESLRAELNNLPLHRVTSSRPYQQLYHQIAYLTNQNDILRRDCEGLTSDLKMERQKVMEERERGSQGLREEREVREKSNRMREEDIQRLRRERDELRGKVKVLEGSMYSRSTVQSLKEQLQQRDSDYNKMKEQMEKLREDSKKLAAIREETRRGQEKLNETLDQRNYEIKDLQGKLREMEKRQAKKQWEERERELKVIIEVYQRESKDRRELHERYRDEVLRLEDRLRISGGHDSDSQYVRDLEVRVNELEDKKKDLTARLVKAERLCKEMKQQNDTQKIANETFTNELAEVTQAYEDSVEQNKKLTSQLLDKEDSLTRFIADSIKREQQQQTAGQDRESLVEQYRQLKDRSAMQDESMARVESKTKLLEAQLRKALDEYRMKEEMMASKYRQMAENESHLTKSTVQRLEDELKDLRIRLQEKVSLAEKEEFKSSSLEEKIEGLNAKISNMKERGYVDNVESDDKDFWKQSYQYIQNKFKCSVCNDREKDHIITRCCHAFCGTCLRKKIELRSRKCPHCGKPFAEQDVHPFF
ncbi:hypothetical protein PROFUN_14652 [Planoprotostelium fungivorum]|uniref:E3 ubiquitin protein ligase n=1 Tax=Planoprotostelium fungivorum TaxID=1890364 RepID=A0A2P6MMQ5_9EUKA|nr:hypothetical protein PROFUN_14652 [Planoprotostelium fungivorum]